MALRYVPRRTHALLIAAYRMWQRFSFAFALLIVLVATPFVLPAVYLWLCIHDRWRRD